MTQRPATQEFIYFGTIYPTAEEFPAETVENLANHKRTADGRGYHMEWFGTEAEFAGLKLWLLTQGARLQPSHRRPVIGERLGAQQRID